MSYKNWSFTFLLLIVFDIYSQSISFDREVIKYGGNIDFYPYEYLDENNQPKGFIIDLLNEITKKTGVKIEIELKPWNSVINSLRNNINYDLTALYYSFDRTQFLYYCPPLLLTYDNLFTNSKASSINDISQLESKEVLVEKGGFASEYFKKKLA